MGIPTMLTVSATHLAAEMKRQREEQNNSENKSIVNQGELEKNCEAISKEIKQFTKTTVKGINDITQTAINGIHDINKMIEDTINEIKETDYPKFYYLRNYEKEIELIVKRYSVGTEEFEKLKPMEIIYTLEKHLSFKDREETKTRIKRLKQTCEIVKDFKKLYTLNPEMKIYIISKEKWEKCNTSNFSRDMRNLLKDIKLIYQVLVKADYNNSKTAATKKYKKVVKK
jgi:hypothetical protein